MRQRGTSTLATVIIAGIAGVLAATLMMDWVVVDVRTTDDDPHHIVAPFPLVLARAATALVPREAFADATVPPELAEQRELVMTVLESLAACPDATLVTVDAPDARVRITKQGRNLLVDVEADDATVHCAIPVHGIRDALARWDWKTVNPKIAFDILGAAPHGDLVRVEAPDARVKVSVW